MAGNIVRVGTRGSLLARTQTEWVVSQLQATNPGCTFTIQTIQTTGDNRRDVPFASIGTKGMFVKEIEQALLDGEIDLAIHSLKDMPSEFPESLALIGVPERENPFDALLSRYDLSLSELPIGAKVGTSSIRRQSQIRHHRPDLHLMELRGNLDTRLKKLDTGEYDAILLACAGLNRLGLQARVSQELPIEICLPAVGQGALALESRTDDRETQRIVETIHDPVTADCIRAERAFQAALQGGCTIPAGAYAAVTEPSLLTLHGLIAAPDGTELLRESLIGDRTRAVEMGREIAMHLLARGGQAYLKG